MALPVGSRFIASAIDPGLEGAPLRRGFARSPRRAGMRSGRIARPGLTTGQGARHVGSSLAPGAGKFMTAGASCASSLPASPVVTMRLAQRSCRSDAARLQQRAYSLVPLRSTQEAASCNSNGLLDWRRASLFATRLAVGAGEQSCCPRVRATRGRRRHAAFQGCGKAALVALTCTASLRVSPGFAAHRLSGDQAGFGARRCEQGRCDYGHQPG